MIKFKSLRPLFIIVLFNQVQDVVFGQHMDTAIPIRTRLLHALEKASAVIPIIGPVTNTLITANKKAIADRPINTIFSFAIVLPFF